MTFFLKNQKGLSLVEIVVVASILGFLGLAISTTFTDLYKMQSRITGTDEANEFGAGLSRYLFSHDTCTAGLKNQTFPIKGKRDLILSSYKVYDEKGAPNDLKKGATIGSKMKVLEFTIADKGDAPTQIVQAGKTLNRYISRVVLKTQSKVGAEWKENKHKNFEFPILVNSKGAVEECNSSASLADSCAASRGVLDAAGNCVPDKGNCVFEGHYTRNTCNGISSTCEPTPAMCEDESPCPLDGKCRLSHECLPSGFCLDGTTTCSAGETCNISRSCLPAVDCAAHDPPPKCPEDIVNDITKKTSCPKVGTSRETGGHSWSYVAECGKKCSQTINVETKYFICLKCETP